MNDPRKLADYARAMVDDLEAFGIQVRIFGGVAIALATNYANPFAFTRRFKDIDFVTAQHDHRRAWDRLRVLGCKVNRRESFPGYSPRAVLWHDQLSVRIDLYSDPLVFNHVLRLGPRIELSKPGLTPSDLLMTKLQTVHLTEKDRNDIAVLLATLAVSTDDFGCLNQSRIIELCRADWGLHFTCHRNMTLVNSWALGEGSCFSGSTEVAERSLTLVRAVSEAPKTLGWRLRSLLGANLQWYFDVD